MEDLVPLVSMDNILISVDQATSVTGFAIYKDGELIKHGKVKFEGTAISRISQVREWLKGLVNELNQENTKLEVALEEIQLQQDVVTFKTLAWLQGALLEMLHSEGIKTELVFATEWKSTCGVKGKGRAEQKRNAQQYVVDKFGIKATQDECDAICLGQHILKKSENEINWD